MSKSDSNQEQTPKQQMLEMLREAESVVIATGSTPKLDEIAAAKALVLILSKLDKKALAIVGSDLPKGAELLKPKNTFTDSLDGVRDFVIELDVSKTKADKFRYNMEDNKLKIFITPFNGSYKADDISTSQGDFNVDVVITLGTLNREEINETVRGHSELLQDATVIAVNNGQAASGFGKIKWHDKDASSLSEMMVSVAEALGAGLDQDVAETLLTGIVSATEKFTNSKTTPKVMTMSAQLMAAGADQHNIITSLDAELNKQVEPPKTEIEEEPKSKPKKDTKPEPKEKDTAQQEEQESQESKDEEEVADTGIQENTDIKLEDTDTQEREASHSGNLQTPRDEKTEPSGALNISDIETTLDEAAESAGIDNTLPEKPEEMPEQKAEPGEPMELQKPTDAAQPVPPQPDAQTTDVDPQVSAQAEQPSQPDRSPLIKPLEGPAAAGTPLEESQPSEPQYPSDIELTRSNTEQKEDIGTVAQTQSPNAQNLPSQADQQTQPVNPVQPQSPSAAPTTDPTKPITNVSELAQSANNIASENDFLTQASQAIDAQMQQSPQVPSQPLRPQTPQAAPGSQSVADQSQAPNSGDPGSNYDANQISL